MIDGVGVVVVFDVFVCICFYCGGGVECFVGNGCCVGEVILVGV